MKARLAFPIGDLSLRLPLGKGRLRTIKGKSAAGSLPQFDSIKRPHIKNPQLDAISYSHFQEVTGVKSCDL